MKKRKSGRPRDTWNRSVGHETDAFKWSWDSGRNAGHGVLLYRPYMHA